LKNTNNLLPLIKFKRGRGKGDNINNLKKTMITKRDVNRQIYHKKLQAMYDDMLNGMSYGSLAKKYGYKNEASCRTQFQMRVFPYIKSLSKS
jgi:hypothetical protein